MSKAQENVKLVERGFAAFVEGDMETVIAMWHPDVLYHGFDPTGERREFRGRDAFFAILMEAMAAMEVSTNELVSAHSIGEEIVVCHIRGTRKPRGASESVTLDFAMVLRVEDGQVTHGTDMVESVGEAFWRGQST